MSQKRAALRLFFEMYADAAEYPARRTCAVPRAEKGSTMKQQYLEAGRISLVLLATVRRYLRALKNGRVVAIALVNLIGNFLLFLPMGAMLPLLYPSMRRTWRFVLLQTLLLLAVESAQLILRCGSCDIDDVILNLAGALAGYLAARLHLRRKRLAAK